MARKSFDKEKLMSDPVGWHILVYLIKKEENKARFSEIEREIIKRGEKNEDLEKCITLNITQLIQVRLNQMRRENIVTKEERGVYKLNKWFFNEIAQHYFSKIIKEDIPSDFVFPFISEPLDISFFGLSPDLIEEQDKKMIMNKLESLELAIRNVKIKQIAKLIKERWQQFSIGRNINNTEKILRGIVGYTSIIYNYDKNADIDVWFKSMFEDYELKMLFKEDEFEIIKEGIKFFLPIFSKIYPLNVGCFYYERLSDIHIFLGDPTQYIERINQLFEDGVNEKELSEQIEKLHKQIALDFEHEKVVFLYNPNNEEVISEIEEMEDMEEEEKEVLNHIQNLVMSNREDSNNHKLPIEIKLSPSTVDFLKEIGLKLKKTERLNGEKNAKKR